MIDQNQAAPPSLKMTLRNDLSEFNRVTPAVHALLEREGVPEEARAAVDLVCEEMLVNVMKYAFPGGGGERRIEFELRCEAKRLVVRIVDDGIPFDPTAAADPDVKRPIEERVPGGLGIFLVKKEAEEMKYRRAGALNVLEVAIRRPGPG